MFFMGFFSALEEYCADAIAGSIIIAAAAAIVRVVIFRIVVLL
jgi:hypothetical protein